MNEHIEQLLYEAGLTAQGCWDELDDYAKEAIQRLVTLTIRECMKQAHDVALLRGVNDDMMFGADVAAGKMAQRFGLV